MRVMILTNVPSPYRVSFFNELGQLADVTVLFERRSASDRDNRWTSEGVTHFNGIFLDGKKLGADASFTTKFRHYLKKRDFDVLVLSNYSSPTVMMAIHYCKRHHIPYWITSDGAFLNEESRWKHALKAYLIGGAVAGLATNEESRRYLASYGLPPECIGIYPFTSLYKRDICSIVPTKTEKQELRQRLGMTERKIVLSVGQFIPRKGYDLLLNAWKFADKDWGIYIIGGQEIPEYYALVKQLQLTNVHFVDFMDKEGLKMFYQAADVFVLPTREDIWGLVVNEAMACGLPIITTDRCGAGAALVHDDVNGYIVPAGDTNPLSEKIKVILENDSLRDRMAQESLKIIAAYTFENMAKTHMDIFKEVQNRQ